ncbi:primosomal protein [Rhodococcus sp. HNM0569]|uniref:primosomal protein n=1 Tax=Rhodococcus sp. HNM0569 TaxID=2716340 RepID=UPI00146B079C|nr:primosomal protein [Rhodococcus sp. HNM0569]NLU81837.1 primosomal protein [Rhodococcus sp. HNM0569]
MAGDIVPIELGLTDGDFTTLWAPRWREGDDEWEAFLGHDDDLYGFESVAELAAFVRTNDDNDLVDHPAWKQLSALSAVEFEPDDNHRYDIVGVPELAAGDPDDQTIAELGDTLEMVRTIGEVCELDSVTKFFNANLYLGALGSGPDIFEGRDGEDLWLRIGAAIAKGWDGVLDAVDEIVTAPAVDASAVEVAEAELVAAAQNTVDADDDAEIDDEEYEPLDLDSPDDADTEFSDEEDTDDTDDTEYDEADETFWTSVGVDPIKIITTSATWYTLRCYLGDDAVFLGRAGTIFVFSSERGLARYLADNHEHALAKVSTYDEIQVAAVDGSLDVEVTDDNVYVLPGLADDLAEGPAAVDRDQLDLAVELFTDAADFAGDDTVDIALASSTPLGWYVSYLLEPDRGRMAPSAPFTEETEAWRELEHGFEARLQNAE